MDQNPYVSPRELEPRRFSGLKKPLTVWHYVAIIAVLALLIALIAPAPWMARE